MITSNLPDIPLWGHHLLPNDIQDGHGCVQIHQIALTEYIRVASRAGPFGHNLKDYSFRLVFWCWCFGGEDDVNKAFLSSWSLITINKQSSMLVFYFLQLSHTMTYEMWCHKLGKSSSRPVASLLSFNQPVPSSDTSGPVLRLCPPLTPNTWKWNITRARANLVLIGIWLVVQVVDKLETTKN